MPNFLKYGLIAAAISSIYSLVLQFTGSDLRFNSKALYFMVLAFPVIFMVLAVRAERSQQEGMISFGEALKTSFLTYMVFIIIAMIVGQLIIGMYSESDWSRMVELQHESMQSTMSTFNLDQEIIDEAISELTVENMKAQSTGVQMLVIGSLMYAFVGLIFSLIISAIMKKNPTP